MNCISIGRQRSQSQQTQQSAKTLHLKLPRLASLSSIISQPRGALSQRVFASKQIKIGVFKREVDQSVYTNQKTKKYVLKLKEDFRCKGLEIELTTTKQTESNKQLLEQQATNSSMNAVLQNQKYECAVFSYLINRIGKEKIDILNRINFEKQNLAVCKQEINNLLEEERVVSNQLLRSKARLSLESKRLKCELNSLLERNRIARQSIKELQELLKVRGGNQFSAKEQSISKNMATQRKTYLASRLLGKLLKAKIVKLQRGLHDQLVFLKSKSLPSNLQQFKDKFLYAGTQRLILHQKMQSLQRQQQQLQTELRQRKAAIELASQGQPMEELSQSMPAEQFERRIRLESEKAKALDNLRQKVKCWAGRWGLSQNDSEQEIVVSLCQALRSRLLSS